MKNLTFEKRRQKMLEAMLKTITDPVYEKEIPFTNNGVPAFLEALDYFEAESRRIHIVII